MKPFLAFFVLLFVTQVPCLSQNPNSQTYPSEILDYQKMIQGAKSCKEKEEAEKNYLTLLGIVNDLATYRIAFLKNGRFINLFPTAYYHTTVSEMERIAKGEFAYPVEKMKQMIAFYDAYKFNRKNWDDGNKSIVEKHWTEHFVFSETEAAESNLLCAKVGHVLATGIVAHVKVDLARAIRYSYANRFDKALVQDNQEYIDDFTSTNEIFKTTSKETIADVAAARTLCTALQMNFSVSDYGKWTVVLNNYVYKSFPQLGKLLEIREVLTHEDVVHLREQAWNDAFQSIVLMGWEGYKLLGQPLTNHISLIASGKRITNYNKQITEEDKRQIKQKTLSYFQWLINTWDQKSTPKFKLLTEQNELNWTEIEKYLTWLNTNSTFLGCNFFKNMTAYFTEVEKKWKTVPKNQKQDTGAESAYNEIFYDWETITTLDGGNSSYHHNEFYKVFDPKRRYNITFYPNNEALVSIPSNEKSIKDLDLLWKKENGEWKIAFTEFLILRWKNVAYQNKLRKFNGGSRN